MININDNIPTSTLLSVKIGDDVTNGKGLEGKISEIKIEETDEYLMFLFSLEGAKQIMIRKLRQVC